MENKTDFNEFNTLQKENSRLKKKLDRFNENYHIISSMISDYIYFADLDENNNVSYEWESTEIEKLHNVKLDDTHFIDENYLDIVHPDDRRKLLKRREIILQNKEHICEYRIYSKDKNIIWLREYIKPVWSSEENRVVRIVGAIQDITAQKEAEKEKENLQRHIQHQKRLEAIGTLAGGIAHEINNPLTGIINYAQLLHEQLDDELLQTFTKGIIEQGQRVADIIKNLLTFARSSEQKPSFTAISEVVGSTLTLIATPLRHNRIALTMDISPELPPIILERQKIQIIVLNLIDNAIHALNQRFPEKNPNKRIQVIGKEITENNRQYIRLSVRDEGVGIPKTIIDRVFDAFFTTKQSDEHAGLGLYEIHNIMRDWNGNVSIESVPEEYTIVHIDIPLESLNTD
jgi:signal transduction histidine kinase